MPPVMQALSKLAPVKPGLYGTAIFPNLMLRGDKSIIDSLAIISNNFRVCKKRGFQATRIKDGDNTKHNFPSALQLKTT